MYDYSKLRGRIVEKYGNIKTFVEKCKLSRVSVSKILNNKIGMSQKTITEWAMLLDIEPSDYYSYFFSHKNRKSD